MLNISEAESGAWKEFNIDFLCTESENDGEFIEFECLPEEMNKPTEETIGSAVELAKKMDFAVVCVGLGW